MLELLVMQLVTAGNIDDMVKLTYDNANFIELLLMSLLPAPIKRLKMKLSLGKNQSDR